MQIANHTFFVTGGSSGLGKATSLLLAEQGANVVIADLAAEGGEALASQFPGRTLFIPTDVTDRASIEHAVSTGAARFGALQGLINCAGILVAERMIKKDGTVCDPEAFRRCLEVNLTGTFETIRQISPLLANNRPNPEGECGVIVNTASIAAYEGQIGLAAYAASKAGIIGMTLPLARELGALGIRVMTIAPGVFETPLFKEIRSEKLDELGRLAPFPSRLGKPSEFAALVRHIIENPMLNGEVIRLDGALRLP